MASLSVPNLTRLTKAARLARMRPAVAVEVEPPGVLRTGRLVIRPLRWDDREAFLEAVRVSRAELDRFCPLHKEGETDDVVFDRQLQLSRAADATGRAWRRIAVCPDRGGRIVGAFNLNDISHGLVPGAEASFWVRTDEAGKGFAREAIVAMLAHAFAPRWPRAVAPAGQASGLGLSRVDGLVAPGNTASLRLLERAGFHGDVDRPTQVLTVHGRAVEHLRFIAHAPLRSGVLCEPRIPKGVSLRQSIDWLMTIEGRAAERGE